MRGLCNGLGPAVFGVIFYLFHVDLNQDHVENLHTVHGFGETRIRLNETVHSQLAAAVANPASPELDAGIPGPPFVFGSFMVVFAILVAAFFLPEEPSDPIRRPSGISIEGHGHFDFDRGGRTPTEALSPLINEHVQL